MKKKAGTEFDERNTRTHGAKKRKKPLLSRKTVKSGSPLLKDTRKKKELTTPA